ncbi:MAG: TIGR04283 family arsenosugar biosynthesis glycosyltransferase [Pseudomonadota bacterium]
MSEPNTVAIVVPVLNESAVAAALGQRLVELMNTGIADVLVVDGGSDDNTQTQLRVLGLDVLTAPRGRAAQMNAGAQATTGSTLVFLHADTALPRDGIDAVCAAIAAGADWGRFDVRVAGRSRWFPMISTLINWRSRISGYATGDQAMFVRRSVFEAVGGFPEQPLMEDIEISRRLRRVSRPACLTETVTTSGRRWERFGVWRTIWLMWRLRFAYWRGVPAEQLAKRYA